MHTRCDQCEHIRQQQKAKGRHSTRYIAESCTLLGEQPEETPDEAAVIMMTIMSAAYAHIHI